MCKGSLNIHFKDFRDVFALVFNGEGFTVEAFSFTHFTLHPHIGEESHIDLLRAVTATRFTPAASDIKTKPSGFIASQFRLWQIGIEGANPVKDFGVGRCVGTGCPPNRCHVNVDNFVNDI